MDQGESKYQEQVEEQGTLDPHCASCNMPMKNPEDFGTNEDGTPNQEYCCHCLQRGNRY